MCLAYCQLSFHGMLDWQAICWSHQQSGPGDWPLHPDFFLTKCHRNVTLHIKGVDVQVQQEIEQLCVKAKGSTRMRDRFFSDPGGPVVAGLCVISPQGRNLRGFHATSEENGSWLNCSSIAHTTLLRRDSRTDRRGPRVPYSLSRPALQGYILSCIHGY